MFRGSEQGLCCMGQLTQEHRLLSITDFSLGKDALVVTAFQGSEYVSGLFEFQIEVLSEQLEISADQIVGKSCTVTVQNDQERKFNGFIKSFCVGEIDNHNHRQYRLTMVPWLWFLTQTSNCRIFQEMTAKDIISDVFNQLGFSDFEFQADGGSSREYCVQYNESDFHFISRLLEEEGIAYYFQHSDSKHQLVMVDQPNAFEECAETDLEYSKGYMPNTQITSWEHIYDFKKGQWSLTDYNFKEPTKNLLAQQKTNSKFANNGSYEHYEYPGFYDFSKGRDLVKIRLEAEEAMRDSAQGSSDCSSFYAGGKFKLSKHESASQKDTYILIAVNHNVRDSSYYTGEEGQAEYSNQFVCIPSSVHFRPSPVHEKPVMKGPQSAIVVGPSGEEIYIDEHARIKVQFYWDREGKNDENSTCFIRVMQSWAGNQWGSSFIPRIGHEVIVNFLDGDPDRPLVTGSVYNGKNKPVFSSKTQSGVRTRSTKDGTPQNCNELRFDDKKGSEQIYVHAEKNLDTEVENDETHSVDNNRTKTIGNNEDSSIGNNRSKSVGNNETESIKKNKSTDVGENYTETVGKNSGTTVGKNMTLDVGDNLTESVGKNMTTTVQKNVVTKVSGNSMTTVSKAMGGKAKTITFEADDMLVLKVGSAKLTMDKTGNVTIKGMNINVKGSANVVIKGLKTTVN